MSRTVEGAIREAREQAEKTFPDGFDFAVAIWPNGSRKTPWSAQLSFRVNNTGWQEETDAGEGADVLDAVHALIGLLEDLATQRKAG